MKIKENPNAIGFQNYCETKTNIHTQYIFTFVTLKCTNSLFYLSIVVGELRLVSMNEIESCIKHLLNDVFFSNQQIYNNKKFREWIKVCGKANEFIKKKKIIITVLI